MPLCHLHCIAILVQYWCNIGSILVQYWFNIGSILVQYWCNIGSILHQYWCNIGALPTRVLSTFYLSHQSGRPRVTLSYQSELTVPFFTSLLYSLVLHIYMDHRLDIVFWLFYKYSVSVLHDGGRCSILLDVLDVGAVDSYLCESVCCATQPPQ